MQFPKLHLSVLPHPSLGTDRDCHFRTICPRTVGREGLYRKQHGGRWLPYGPLLIPPIWRAQTGLPLQLRPRQRYLPASTHGVGIGRMQITTSRRDGGRGGRRQSRLRPLRHFGGDKHSPQPRLGDSWLCALPQELGVSF